MNLIDKLENNQRLEFDDAIKLYDLDLFTLGKYANKIREAKNGKKVYFNINRHINPTNLCADVCKFCAFSSHRQSAEKSYTMSYEQIIEAVDKSVLNGAKEIHIVSAHNPNVSWQWYLEIFKMIKDKYPNLKIINFKLNRINKTFFCFIKNQKTNKKYSHRKQESIQ